MRALIRFLPAFLLSAACSSEPSAVVAVDASPIADQQSPPTSAMDASTLDATNLVDRSADAGSINDILGTFADGTVCPLVTADLTSSLPSVREDKLIFVAGETYVASSLSPGGQIMFNLPNAGGSSGSSEVMSFEILHYCEGATFLKTETEILYAPPDDSGANIITDYLAEIQGLKVGVQVSRAYQPKPEMTDAQVLALLNKKLDGVNRSSQRVLPADKWVKQILHIFADDVAMHTALVDQWANVDPEVKADTILLVTETQGGGFIYCHPEPALGSECP